MSKEKSTGKYDDIINLPHHVSKKHPPMPMIKRAAQFAPFAALTGYDDAVEETARVTDEMVVLSDEQMEELNHMIHLAMNNNRTVCIHYFEPDQKKSGGRYCTVTGKIRKAEFGVVVLDNGMRVDVDRVVQIEETCD